jgi:hypothetical protein
VTPLDPEVFDVGGARLADSQSIEPEQHRERGVLAVVLLGGEEERVELEAIQTASVRGVDLRPADVLHRVRGDASVDVSEPVEPADGREPSVDRGSGQTAIFHRGTEQLDMRARGLEHDHAVVGRPLEEATQVMAVRLERASAVPSQERRGGQLGIVNRVVGLAVLDGRARQLDGGHGWSSCSWEAQFNHAAPTGVR